MKERKWALLGAALSLLFFLKPGAAISESLRGSYEITFYSLPSLASTATQCLVFTQTGTIKSQPLSGTWTSPTFSGWDGEWIQRGDHIDVMGFTTSGLASIFDGNFYNTASSSGTFDTWVPSANSNAGLFAMSQVTSCPGAAAVEGGLDPTAP